MAVQGAIAARARSNFPGTWDALEAADGVSGTMLRDAIDDVKYQLFGEVVDPSLESSNYSRLVLDYVGKIVAVNLVPAGVDYWMVQPSAINTSEVTENETYPDRVAALWKLQESLILQIKAMEADVNAETDIVVRAEMGIPLISDAGVDLITSDPHDFGREFDVPTGTGL